MSRVPPRPVARYRAGQVPAAPDRDSSSSDEDGPEAPAPAPAPVPLPSRVAVPRSAGVMIQHGNEAIQHPGGVDRPDVDLDEYGTWYHVLSL